MTSTSDLPPLGGYFSLDPSLLEEPPRQDPAQVFDLEPGRHAFLATGRGALRLALGTVDFRGRDLLVPEFLCGRVFLDLLADMGIAWRSYPVGPDLCPAWEEVSRLADSAAAVVAINYFGVKDQGPGLARLKETHPGLVTILDCVLDPFYLARVPTAGQDADLVLTSFRKVLPLPDGAVLRAREELCFQAPAETDTDPSVEAWLAGALLKHSFLSRGGKVKEPLFVAAHERAKALLSNQVHAASAAGKAILERVDLEQVSCRRRENYTRLAAALPPGLCRPVCPELPPGAVPTHLPVMVGSGRRDPVQKALARRGIFCPVHWPQDPRLGQVGPDGQKIYRDILSLVVDQRMKAKDVDRLAAELSALAEGK